MDQLKLEIVQLEPRTCFFQGRFRNIHTDKAPRTRLCGETDTIVAGAAAEIEHGQTIMPSHRHQIDVVEILRIPPAEIT
jgi:hypothetical protein